MYPLCVLSAQIIACSDNAITCTNYVYFQLKLLPVQTMLFYKITCTNYLYFQLKLLPVFVMFVPAVIAGILDH